MFDYTAPISFLQECTSAAATPLSATNLSAAKDKSPPLIPDFGPVHLETTVFILYQPAADARDTLAFEDVSYYAATSSMRLGLVCDALTAVETGNISTERLSTSAGMLAGLCQSVSETLEHLRRTADLRLSQKTQKPAPEDIPLNAQETGVLHYAMIDLMQGSRKEAVLPWVHPCAIPHDDAAH